jgi:hypothetical protein
VIRLLGEQLADGGGAARPRTARFARRFIQRSACWRARWPSSAQPAGLAASSRRAGAARSSCSPGDRFGARAPVRLWTPTGCSSHFRPAIHRAARSEVGPEGEPRCCGHSRIGASAERSTRTCRPAAA